MQSIGSLHISETLWGFSMGLEIFALVLVKTTDSFHVTVFLSC